MVAAALMPTAYHPLSAPQLAWWRYVERGRTHEVLAEWREREGVLLLRETSPSALDVRVEERLGVEQPWEARVALWTLEARLSQLGEYWRARSVASGWSRLGRPLGAPAADPRRNEVLDEVRATLVHHYHDAHGGGDQIVAALRTDHAARYLVLRAQLDVPSLDIGRIDVLHPRVPDAITRSLVMREQIALTQAGLPKLVTRDDYKRSFGDGGERRATRLVDEVLTRVRDGQLKRPAPRLEESDVYAEFLVTLHDPKLLALHKRFLAPGEEDAILAAGPPGIRKAIATKRALAPHTQQHLLTILEASLLARERMASGKLTRSDPEVRALTRLAYYL